MTDKLAWTSAYRKTKKGLLVNLFCEIRKRRGVSFSIDWFFKFSECQKFNRLYNEWVNSGYKKDLKPSIDRINNKLGYTERNIQWLTWHENFYKGNRETQRANGRAVFQLKNGIIVREFRSVAYAAMRLQLHVANICKVIDGSRNQTGGFTFKYKNV